MAPQAKKIAKVSKTRHKSSTINEDRINDAFLSKKEGQSDIQDEIDKPPLIETPPAKEPNQSVTIESINNNNGSIELKNTKFNQPQSQNQNDNLLDRTIIWAKILSLEQTKRKTKKSNSHH